jgi:hypothetical protein
MREEAGYGEQSSTSGRSNFASSLYSLSDAPTNARGF